MCVRDPIGAERRLSRTGDRQQTKRRPSRIAGVGEESVLHLCLGGERRRGCRLRC